MKNNTAYQLNVEVPGFIWTQCPAARFPNYSKCFDKQIINRFSSGKTCSKLVRFCTELIVCERFHSRLKRVYLLDSPPKPPKLTFIGAKKCAEESHI
jgi:hypothetical protein